MSRIPFVLFLAAALLVTSQAASAQDSKDTPPPLGTASFEPPQSKNREPLTPAVFAVRAAVANMSEIELSELALQRSADPQLRQFASQLIQDNKSSQAQLKKIAADAKIALPGTVDEARKRQKGDLAEKTGIDFDRQFVATIHSSHEQAVTLLESASTAPELDATFKSYAREALDKVENHRDAADKLLSQAHR